MTPFKRFLDLVGVVLIGLVVVPLTLIVAVLVLIKQGRPIFYVSERMRAPGRPFQLIKFRTMEVVDTDSGVSGGDKSNRITPFGATLRRLRLDELPQLWNVFRGDMTFVGPRPPLRVYVEDYPELYDEVLKCRPGVTGLASIHFHAHEAKLLADCNTPEETDAVYRRRCIPRKAHIDILYRDKRTICFDIWLMIKTIL